MRPLHSAYEMDTPVPLQGSVGTAAAWARMVEPIYILMEEVKSYQPAHYYERTTRLLGAPYLVSKGCHGRGART